MRNKIKKLIESSKWFISYMKGHKLSILLILICNIAGSLSNVAIAITSKNLVDIATSGDTGSILKAIVVFAAIIIVFLGTNAVSTVISTRTLEAFSNDMRERLFARISMTEWMEISRYHSGDVLTRLTSDVSAITSGIVSVIPSVFSLGIQMAAAFATLLYFEPYLALIAFALGPAAVLFSRLWGRRLKKLHIKLQETESEYRSFIQESLEHLTIIKAFGLEGKKNDTISSLHGKRMDLVNQRNKTNVAVNTILSGGYWLGYLAAFAWGAIRLSQKATTFGTMTAFLQLVGQVQSPFIGLAHTYPRIVVVFASAERLKELEGLELEKKAERLPESFSVGVVFKDVCFSYSKDEKILDSVSFNLVPGETLALIGPSGEGKTTVIRLILALLKPDSGSVLFRDEKGNEYTVNAATRNWVAYVPQGNTLFSGTVAENIRCGNPDATDDELKEAAETACAWEFIERLPEGMETVLGEHGLGLSEGQAQRISIARAILRKAPVLILDEATSALDIELEMRVLEGIRNLRQERACLVITHRLTALQISSRVLKLEDGKLFVQYLNEIKEKVIQ